MPKRTPLPVRFWAKVTKDGPGGCWRWHGCTHQDGYGMIGLDRQSGDRRNQMAGAHRVSWELHNGPIPDGLCVLHSCDNPPCTNPAHLFLGTNDDNIADKVAKERQQRGTKIPHATLTDDMAAEIYRLYLTGGYSRRDLAERFNVGSSTVGAVVMGQGWAHVTGGQPHGLESKQRFRGGRAPSKLTPDDVREIRRMAGEGFTQSEIAAKFKVHQVNVSLILRGKTWAYVV